MDLIIRQFMEMISYGIHIVDSTSTNVNYEHNLLESFVTEAARRSLVQVAGQWGNDLAARDQVDQWGAGAQIWAECVGAPTLPRWPRCQPAVDLRR